LLDAWDEGVFLARPNRFLAEVVVGGRKELAHLPDPGRLTELLRAGAEVRLQRARSAGRSTSWTLIGVRCSQGWVNIDSRLPNALFEEALSESRLEEFAGFSSWRREAHFGGSVMDFLLQGEQDCLVEVKGCTLVQKGVALFPDAPTTRGARHMGELQEACARGLRACAVFMVKHPAARLFRPNRVADPSFAQALSKAVEAGVEAYAYLASWRGREIRIARRLPAELA